MGTVCAVREADGLWEPFSAMLEADGNKWELNAPYGGHMGAMCTEWEPCVRHMGAACEPYGSHFSPYGSQNCANYEADGAIWELYAPYGSHMEAVWAVWEVNGAIWATNAPYRGYMGAIWRHVGGRWHHMGGRWHHVGGRWHHVGGRWHNMGAACAVWGPYGSGVTVWTPCMPYGSHMRCQLGALWSIGAVLPHVGAMCDHMGAFTLHRSHIMPFAPSVGGKELVREPGSHMYIWFYSGMLSSTLARLWQGVSLRIL
jgi:hypothetical protein